MYNFKYNLIKENESVKTLLYAKFRFENEIAPKDRKEVRDRIECQSVTIGNSLLYYMINNEGFDFEDWKHMEKDGKMLSIDLCLFQLGFDVKVVSEYEKSLEGMLDLDKLNEFILTKKV